MACKKESAILKALGLGISTCIAIGTCGAMMIAWLMLSNKIGERGCDVVICVTLVTATFFGSMITTRSSRIRLLFLATTAGFTVILMITGLLIFEGGISGAWKQMTAIVCGGTMTLAIPSKKVRRMRSRKPMSC